MSTKGRENWEKYKAGYVSTRLAEEVSTGNAGRDSWNELKKTIRFDKPESTQDVVSGSGAQAEEKSFLQRAGLTVSGGAKGSLAGNMDAMGVAYELGQSGRTQRYTEELREAQWAVARAKHDYDADPNNWQTKDTLDTAIAKMKGFADTLGKGAYEQALTAAYDAASKFDTGDLKALYNGLGVVDPEQGTGVQQQAASAARDLAYGVQESASKDLQEAKEGASKFGQMLVDAGASMTQMALDAAANRLMGTEGTMIPFATRAFGGSTMDARQDGADLKGQVLYGGAQAAKEVFTEKMFNIALPFAKAYGKGGLDSVVENGIRKAAEKLGKSDIGRAALERVLKFGASAASEGLEEFVGDFFEWQMPRIYGGDTDSFSEMFSNALYDFAVGTISGAAGGAVEGGVDLYNDHAQAREAKKVYGDQAQELVNKSKELNPDNELAEKYQKKLDKGKNLSGFQLMRIMQQNENGIVEQDKQKIQTAAESRLTQLGETGDTAQIARVITKQVAGEQLTSDERSLIDGSRYGRRVANEIDPENVKAVATKDGIAPRDTFASEWTGKLDTKRIYPEVFNRLMPQAQKTGETTTQQEGEVTGAKYNPETGKLDAIVKDDAGKIETVPAEKAELSPLQEELFDWAADLGEAGSVLVSAYRQTQNLETYARQFHNAYEYGKAGVPMDYVNRSQAVSYLNTTQREIAYEEGAKAHQRELQGHQEKKRSGGTVDSSAQKKPTVSLRGATVGGVKYAAVNKKAMDGRQWASVGTMKAFAQATGVNVVFYESQANERGEYEGANGFYKDGTLYLDINAGRDRVAMGETAILKTAAHEITHYIKEGGPKQYEVLKNFVVEKLTREKGISFDDLVTDKQRREPGLSYEEAVDEVVADACEMMLKDSKAVEQLARENRSLAERIRQWIRKWVRSLKAAMEGLTADRPESRTMMQYAQELQEIWDNALVDAVRNGRGAMRGNAPAEVRQQARVGTDEKSGKPIYQSNFPKGTPKAAKAQRILSLIQNVWSKKPISLVVQNADGSTRTIEAKFDPTYIEEEGVQTDAKKLMGGNRHGSASEQRVTLDLADDYYEIAAESTYNYSKSEMGKTSPTHEGVKQWHYFINDILFQEYGEKETTPYRVTINVKERSDGEFVYSFSAERQNERLSTRRTLHADDTQSARGGESNAQPSVDSIRQSNANSQVKSNDKVQNSMRDSVGRELTEAQQEYFKDSKVRDADGQLKPVYHGSTAIFTKFSADFMSQNGSSEGQGFYFTDYKPMAQGYEKNGGQLLEGYLDIKKPLSDSEVTLTAAEVKQLIKAVDPTGDDLVLNYDSRGGIGYPSRAWYNRSVEDTLRATMSTSESDSEILAELANGMGDPGKVLKTVRELLGYDGYIVEGKYDNATVYVAFDSSQFKNADNKTPTADPDIRFQQREPRLSDRAVLLWAAEKAVSERSKRWSIEDLNRFDILVKKLKGLDEAYAELEALKEERTVQLAGRKESELKGEERFKLNQTKNRIQTQKDKIQRLEADTYRIESIPQMKELLRKSRSIVEAEASYKARREYIERREAQEEMAVTRRKVERNAKRLLEYMNTNTDKKHIPEALKKPIGELLESLNFYSNSARRGGYTSRADLKYYEAMQGLQAALATQRAFDDTGEGTDVFKGYLDLPAGFESLLAVHVERVKLAMEKHPLETDVVRAMSLEDLKNLDVILSVMSRSVTKMNEMLIKRRFAYVADAAEDSIIAMQRLGQHQDKTGERFALWDNTLPWYAFQRFGEGGKAVFEGLQDGWDKLAFNMKTILDFRQGLISDALARKWDTETHKVELNEPDGSTVTATLTTAQLMSLYCLSKRKQALGHLLGGGIRPNAIEITNTLGDKIKKKKLNQDKQFKLTEESLGQLLKLLTPEQIKVADAMQKFMTEQGSTWGNAISMERFGYRAFTEQNYFPIETDRQDREAKTGDAKEGSLYRLQNISAVKPLVKNANNALILRGIFDVFANHTADMAKYNALVLPIIDAQKWYNYRYGEKNEAGQVYTKTVQRAMTKAYGEVANNFVITFLRDLNGVKESSDRGTSKAERSTSFYKRTAVAANIRVALLQPTAYVRASFALDYKYLAKAFLDKTSTAQAKKEMLENSGIALWKSLGFFDTDVGRSIRDQIKGKSSKIEDLVDKTMVPAEKGDEVTWARLWRACKLEVQDKQHLTGEELLKATAERFREVIYQTQVVDSTMTRSHNMRAGSAWAKTVTAFMSEPTVSYNMVMESTRKTAEDAKRMGMRVAVKRNGKTLVRAAQAYVLTEVASAIIESLTDAFRDPDDDPFLEKFWTAFWGEKPESFRDAVLGIVLGTNGNLVGNLNLLGKIPLLKDALSALSGEDVSRMDMEALTNTYKALAIWDETIRLENGSLDKATKTTYYGNMTPYGKLYQTSKALSQLSGLPISSTMREAITAWNNTVGIAYPDLKARTYQSKQLKESWENYGKASGVSYAVMYRATQDTKEFESDKDKDGNTISGSLKAKYVDYIKGLGLNRAQGKAVWEAAKNPLWSDKGTPWG